MIVNKYEYKLINDIIILVIIIIDNKDKHVIIIGIDINKWCVIININILNK